MPPAWCNASVELVCLPDAKTVADVAAQIVATTLRTRPAAALVAATGATPMPTYDRLATMRARGGLPVREVTVFQLDAYLGIAQDDPRALARWSRERFVQPLGIAEDRFVRLPGDTSDPQRACRAYDRAVREAGGFDLAILGLGPNGHLGFNEPPSAADAPTRRVTLTEESLDSNAAYWGDRDLVPREALTAGMDLLLAARTVLLIVTGSHKRDVLHRTLHGSVGPHLPASFLRRAPHAIVVADALACGADG